MEIYDFGAYTLKKPKMELWSRCKTNGKQIEFCQKIQTSEKNQNSNRNSISQHLWPPKKDVVEIQCKRRLAGELKEWIVITTQKRTNSWRGIWNDEDVVEESQCSGNQPLHVGFLGDEGGNTITVRWYRRKTNLHHVWDNMIIESALKTYYNKSLPLMIQALQANLTHGWSNDVPSWESCQLNQTACPNSYASESISLACKYAYRNATPGTTLGDEYFLSRLPIVEKRLAQGGIRLAATLNRIFSSKPKLAGA
ncbi:hypothetical protein F2Q70_00005615 [Brassica cretica]|uniref:Aspergillus nuclease S1 n=1 Tax=Brassica cretica TaxID=69181 RepID=A0A8S9IQU2_BRACR|nr:hypothetical protein F2Q70_00005615 [Brassica cretica]